jgi:transcriptional regulator with XRE-family HTH domain
MKNRSHPLRIYCAQHGISLQEFAAANNFGYDNLGKAIRGQHRVTQDFVERIVKATNGIVAAKDFLITKRNVKITPSARDAIAIRRLGQRGMLQKDIAKTYGISPSTVSRIVNGSRHKV